MILDFHKFLAYNDMKVLQNWLAFQRFSLGFEHNFFESNPNGYKLNNLANDMNILQVAINWLQLTN